MSYYEEITTTKASDTEAVILLKEWLQWWANDATAPAKLPGSLQTRTTAFLAVEHYAPQSRNLIDDGEPIDG